MVEISEYKDLFVEEAREHLKTLNQSLLDFEKNPKDKDTMNKIFRAAHTIKGMSATMNYDRIQKLSHRTEDALDLIRNNKLEVTSEVIDLIFKCFDGIETMVENIADNNMTDFDITGLVAELERQMGDSKKAAPMQPKGPTVAAHTGLAMDAEAKTLLIKEIMGGRIGYWISVEVDKNCTMKSIRSFILLKKLHDKGMIVTGNPPEKNIENGEFDVGFELFYVSDLNKEALEKIVQSVSELSVTLVSQLQVKDDDLILDTMSVAAGMPLPETSVPKTPVAPDTKVQDAKAKPVISEVQSIRIGMDQLDHFMNLIGELVISKGRLAQIAQEHHLDDLVETTNTVDRLTTDLQDKIM